MKPSCRSARFLASIDVDPVWRLERVRGRVVLFFVVIVGVMAFEALCILAVDDWGQRSQLLPVVNGVVFALAAGALAVIKNYRLFELVEALATTTAAGVLVFGTYFQEDPLIRHREQGTAFILAILPPFVFGTRARLYFPHVVLNLAVNLLGTLWVEGQKVILLQPLPRHPHSPGSVEPHPHAGPSGDFPLKLLLSNLVVLALCLAAAVGQGRLMRAMQVTETDLHQEKIASETLLAMLCDGFCVLAPDGSTIIRSDAKFDGMMGRTMLGETLFGAVWGKDDDPQLANLQDALRRFAEGDCDTWQAGVAMPMSLKGFGGERIPVTLHVVGRRAGAASARERGASLLVGVSQVLEQERLDHVGDALSPCAGAATSVDSSSDLPSEGTTDVFKISKANVASAFADIVSLGLREHWAISETEVNVEPTILGVGSFGQVMGGIYYGSPIVVKVVSGISKRTPVKAVASLAHELRVLRHCRHPNLVQFTGAVIDPENFRIALILERVSGGDLTQWMAQQPRPPESHIFSMMLTTCNALWYLHSQSPTIVHGDLKSDNVLVGGQGDVPVAKLADFGLASVVGSSRSRARTGVGILRWMAPEVARREVPLHPGADIFSLGRLLQFLATGRLPHEGVALEVLRRQLAAREITQPPAGDYRGELGRRLCPVTLACSAFGWKERPTAAELRRAVALLANAVCDGKQATFCSSASLSTSAGAKSSSPSDVATEEDSVHVTVKMEL